MKYGAIFFVLITISGWSQDNISVSGEITNRYGEPLSGAHISLLPDSLSVAVSDEQGFFIIAEATPGRWVLQVRMVGFQTYQEELLIIAGKSIFKDIILDEQTRLLEQVEITAGSPMQTAGNYSIGIEKALRMPGNFFDPVRMTSVLPGVATTNDQTNGITFRGYSPNGLLWRLNGLDIVNPNHLSNAGTLSDRPVANGGGVSILSSQVLDRTNFQFGILNASAGNALSGAVDLQFRKGNTDKKYYTVQAGLVGLDLATEGPISEKKNSSYLVNYRYSTVGLLSSAGLDFGGERISFNDLTFNINTDHTKSGSTSFFGFAGISSNAFASRAEAEWQSEKDRYDIDYSGKTYGMGVKDERAIGKNMFLRSAMAWSGQFQVRQAIGSSVPVPNLKNQRYESDRSVLSFHTSLLVKGLPGITSETGVVLTGQRNKLLIFNENTTGDKIDNWDGAVNGWLFQPYSEWRFSVGSIELKPSIRYTQFTYNNTGSFDPRMTVSAPLFAGQFSVGFGRNSQIQQTQWYLPEGNKELPLTRTEQLYAEYLKAYASGLTWRIQAFRHRLSNVPITPWDGLPLAAIPISTLNLQEELVKSQLISDGIGKNEGAEFVVEKRFEDQLYFLVSGSVYRSLFGVKGSDHYWAGRFDGRFTSAAAAGKEWDLSRNVFGLHLKALSFGGQRERLIDEVASAEQGYTIYDPMSRYSVQLPNYFRIDLRASWRKNLPGRTRTVSIDVQNLTSRENAGGYYFDTFKQQVILRKQLGIIPVVTWRLEF